MSNLEAWLIIILVVGVIASNLAVLKYSAKFKMPQFGKDHKVKPKTDDTSKRDTQADTGSADKQDEDRKA
ncbi:DUF2897 family protein [uncultured Shewanella sp.]|uniref:DUF2897 family protein n=1 Tax=Shewanella atlantica TaxID=271099 RepID=UPI00260933F8|nr:DUF2897 family protein [uncultured Shewanella sp.]